ncbi:GntR family transcriptional regulator [Pediococcus inopinatus]|uniref:GntR family transcriptional regulator n=1 Tax=Pediococcus inopinatus TaxID=114090 RepID=UPI002B2589F9|nr:GntR family transcriptional regulator [Pediococcus inopinatus]WPC18290.1 GntR family transcriptional regulator [Pediococcus inopinatus]
MEIKIDKNSMIPIYTQITNGIRDMLDNGELQNGDQIESEKQLCARLDVSRGTVRKGLDVLIKEGRITKIHGKGTFVTNPDVEYPLGNKLYSFAETLSMQNLSFNTQVIRQDLLPANQEIARNLHIPVGSQYLFLERIRSVQEDKIMLIENHINLNACSGIEKINFNNASLFEEIEEHSKRKIQFARSTYEALTIGANRGRLLELPPTAPILKMQQTVYFSEKDPIEYGAVWLKANKYFLTTTLQRR